MNTNTDKNETIKTKLKFTRSEKTGAYVGFVSQNNKTGKLLGVRQDSPYPKKICVLDTKSVPCVLLNTLYDVSMIPMQKNNGYIVIEATPTQFAAHVTTSYVPKALYRVEVNFGNKQIIFDPLDGEKNSVRFLNECVDLISKRVDIKNIDNVVDEFRSQGWAILEKFKSDGFLYKK